MTSLTNSGLSPFWTELSLKKWWKENFRLFRRTFEYIVQVAGPDLAYFWRENKRCRKRDGMQLRLSGHHGV